jgi:riboflavin synthase
MFSGIVEMGYITSVFTKLRSLRLEVNTKNIRNCKIGDSVAINGVCLTVVDIDDIDSILYLDATPETLRRTNLSLIQVGDRVNIERALKVGDYIGGHIVQGHVDDVGEILSVYKRRHINSSTY